MNKISSIGGSEYIPKCYKYSNLDDKSVLYTEYKSGQNLQEKYLENKNNVQLQLIWCDLNPENILINEKNGEY